MAGCDGPIDGGVNERKRRRKRENKEVDCERKKKGRESLVHHN